MVVINGQPFYQSTGRNTGTEGCWYPFFVLIGSDAIDVTLMPDYIDQNAVQWHLNNPRENRPGWIMKFSRQCLKERPKEIFKDPQLNLRMPTLPECLIPSMQLAGDVGKFPEYHNAMRIMTDPELELAIQPIELNKSSDFNTSDEDKINKWLVEQGAIVAGKVFPHLIPKKEFKSDPPLDPSARKQVHELICDSAYWQTKHGRKNKCPIGIHHMQRHHDANDHALFAEYRHIARARRREKNCLSYLFCCLPDNLTRHRITNKLYIAFEQSNTFEELVKNKHYLGVVNDYREYEQKSLKFNRKLT